jgi:hypothetical protein
MKPRKKGKNSNMKKLCIALGLVAVVVIGQKTASAQLLDPIPPQLLDLFPGLDENSLQLVAPQFVPKSGTFWHIPAAGETQLPPYPCPPPDLEAPIYALGSTQFLVDDSAVRVTKKLGLRITQPPPPGGGGSGTNTPPRPNIVNPAKYATQFFSLLDTNAVAASNTNLYRCITNFPPASTGPTLQVKAFGANCIVVKANHFNYSAETRDFALLICDNPARAIWKNLSLTSRDTNDGWLVEGTVAAYKVTDPMWMMISNISSWPAVLRAIPYGGPKIQLTGYAPNAVVTNSITLQATASDLSGVTNENYSLTLNGVATRASFSGNTITCDTRYNVNGPQTFSLAANNLGAQIYNPANPPLNQRLVFSASGTLALDLENPVYVAWGSDMCSPAVGTNHMLFYVNKAQQIAATISNPTNGTVMASYGGYVPFAANVDIGWNFTMADHVTPYGGDKYVVTFTAYDPATLTITNTVDRVGVRTGAGTMISYEWEDPSYHTPNGQWLNDQADTWLKGTLLSLYQDIYKSTSLTQYQPWMVGNNRNMSDSHQRDAWSVSWPTILSYLSGTRYSDFTMGPAHGSGAFIGGDPAGYLIGNYSPQDLQRYVATGAGQNWRLRKVAFWPCYSGTKLATAGGLYSDFGSASGIRPHAQQETTYMRKNCGFFIGGEINQYGFGGDPTVSTAKVAASFDELWVCGPNAFPGGCDPTYSFLFVYNNTVGAWNPELGNAIPLIDGYFEMIYSSVYDDLLMVNNTSFVHP